MSRKDFSTEVQYREQLFKELIEIVGELGWTLALPDGEDDDEVPGMIIGTETYVAKTVEAVDNGSSTS